MWAATVRLQLPCKERQQLHANTLLKELHDTVMTCLRVQIFLQLSLHPYAF